MKLISVGMLIMASTSVSAETAKVPGHAWVTVMNLDPIANGNAVYSFGYPCSIDKGGTVTEIAEDEATRKVLVKYYAQEKAYGAACPSGTLFELSSEVFASMNSQAEAASDAEQEERSRIARLLKKSESEQPAPRGPSGAEK